MIQVGRPRATLDSRPGQVADQRTDSEMTELLTARCSLSGTRRPEGPAQTSPIPDSRQNREPERAGQGRLRVYVRPAVPPAPVALRSRSALTRTGGEPRWPGGGMGGSPCTARVAAPGVARERPPPGPLPRRPLRAPVSDHLKPGLQRGGHQWRVVCTTRTATAGPTAPVPPSAPGPARRPAAKVLIALAVLIVLAQLVH